jgi:hypothetical protein
MVTRSWRYGTIHIEALERVLNGANGLHATGSEAPAAHREQAEAAFILGKHLNPVVRGVATDRAELLKTR